jgi:hypothetical protein
MFSEMDDFVVLAVVHRKFLLNSTESNIKSHIAFIDFRRAFIESQ